ncbi:MAG: PQQ-dependent sugar dehydrogenase [Chloroflexi bacterium]|nr:PQQ-dependent sugar dehydrogenase [Chloroflexota bacterium]
MRTSESILIWLGLLWFLVACSADSSTQEAPPTEAEAELPQTAFVSAIPDPENIRLTSLVSGLELPLFLTHAGDGSRRLFVVEQGGLIRIIQNGELREEPFLDVSHLADSMYFFDELTHYSENGLLGMAFHPNYAENGLFFIHYTDYEGDSVLERYQVDGADPNRADPASGQVILTVDQPHHWHNGGMLAFGPDGYLYVALGEGGIRDRVHSQRLNTLLGSILRIDVILEEVAGYTIPADNPYDDVIGVKPEIWSYGLRNPWRFSFDRATGDLWIGDVGGGDLEELNFQSVASRGGENYGWPDWDTVNPGPQAIPFEETSPPIFFYSHDYGNAIIAGYVYRGQAIEDLYGVFLFGDFGSGRIWTIYRREDGGWQVNEYLDTDYNISSFGEDEEGELYVIDYFNGSIWKFVPQE